MKKLLLCLFVFAIGFSATAQQLAPDQNPNYEVSMAKYASLKNSEPTTMNTTIQSTYKAYDFQTAKLEKKALRRADRRENRLFNNYNQQYYDPYNFNGLNYNGRPYQYRNYNGWRW